jgi:hypothetical protein
MKVKADNELYNQELSEQAKLDLAREQEKQAQSQANQEMLFNIFGGIGSVADRLGFFNWAGKGLGLLKEGESAIPAYSNKYGQRQAPN